MQWWEKKGNLEVKGNRLFLCGIACAELARAYGTPLYAINADRVIENFQSAKKAFSACANRDVRVHFALKANSNLFLLKLLQKEGAWVDAVSPNEVRMALLAGFPKEKILFTGTSVSNNDLKELAELGVTVNVDSFSQLRRFAALRPENKNISIRWNPGVGAGHHGHVITAGKFIKFGVPEKKILNAFSEAKKLGLNVIGLHQHIGSGWLGKDVNAFLATVGKTLLIARKAEKILGKPLEFVDFGGGPGIRYKKEQKDFPLNAYAKGICNKMKKSKLGAAIAIEPGRFIVGDSTVLLTEVNTVEEKNVPILGVDSGFNSLIRPSFYGAYHEIVNCNNVHSRKTKKVLVAGNLCESGDAFNQPKEKLRALPETKEGDVLAILCAGAYGYSMASTYNLRGRPAEAIVQKGRHFLATEREKFYDLIALHKKQ
ncbi:MAG: diaminopimelate decarboxylase [Candidatus Diapherotrites archaeon]